MTNMISDFRSLFHAVAVDVTNFKYY